MKSFAVRGLEFHSQRMWEQKQIVDALELMDRLHLNTLIFHQNDLMDQIVLPARYFPSELMWKRWPVRYHRTMNNRHYLRNIVRLAHQRGIQFVAEVKEIWFDEWLIELFPHLRNANGTLCASDPFWREFVEQKVREFIQAVPDIAGISVSLGTRESKVSISTNTCTCERCGSTSATDWYYNLLLAMYRPLKENDKLLAVRDFAYSAEQQSSIMQAASRVADDIVISLKNTPHDYYPTFPNNPQIGHAGKHPQWVEFDTWGQFFGLGFFPASVVEDIQHRMSHCHDQGVAGITLRTDWENMTEACSFNSLNFVNVFAGGMLSSNLDTELDDIYRAWAEYGLFDPMKTASCDQPPVAVKNRDDYRKLRDFMRASWRIIEKSIFVRGHVLHEDCMFPDTLNRAFDMMTRIHGMDDWKPGASKLVEATVENISAIYLEKEDAIRGVAELEQILDLEHLSVDEPMRNDLKEIIDLFKWYVLGFDLCARVCYTARSALRTRSDSDFFAVRRSLETMQRYVGDVESRLAGKNYPHHVYWLLDYERVQCLIQDVQRELIIVPV
jgi:hypothetical protein